MPEYLGALDQGTTSTRFVLYTADGTEVARHQLEHRQIFPQPGWVEHDPEEIWERACAVITGAMARAGISAAEIAAVGIANQRETAVVWDRRSGRPLTNAIVWQDARTAPAVAELERRGLGALLGDRTGLVPATYFSATKLQWILDHVEGARHAAQRGDLLFGTIDSWLIWKLTGGQHVTDVTNASRTTMLMDLRTLDWDAELLDLFGVPRQMLPEIGPSAARAARLATLVDGPFGGAVAIAASLGDQQAAMVGQACFGVGETKCTYGTGSFLLTNTGTEVVRSHSGLLTTVCYQFATDAPRYALEGAVAVTGSAVQWLRDQLGVIQDAAESESLAARVPSSEGLYFVPAFSGLFAPHWRPDARGVIVGMSRFHNAAHLARATLEAICWQTSDLVEILRRESGAEIAELRVDGGVSANALCMQTQADVLGIPVVRPEDIETTARGAASAAGLAIGLFADEAAVRAHCGEGRRWLPSWDTQRRSAAEHGWHKAVQRTLDWVEPDDAAPLAT